MTNRQLVVPYFPCWEGDSKSTAITSFMYADRSDIDAIVNFDAGKCQKPVLWLDRDDFYFFDSHKARGGYVCLFEAEDQKNGLGSPLHPIQCPGVGSGRGALARSFGFLRS